MHASASKYLQYTIKSKPLTFQQFNIVTWNNSHSPSLFSSEKNIIPNEQIFKVHVRCYDTHIKITYWAKMKVLDSPSSQVVRIELRKG